MHGSVTRRAFLRQEKVAKKRFYRNRWRPTAINPELKIKVKASEQRGHADRMKAQSTGAKTAPQLTSQPDQRGFNPPLLVSKPNRTGPSRSAISSRKLPPPEGSVAVGEIKTGEGRINRAQIRYRSMFITFKCG